MAGILESKETGNEQPDSVYIKVQALGGDYRVDKSSLRFTLTLSCPSSTPLFLLLGQVRGKFAADYSEVLEALLLLSLLSLSMFVTVQRTAPNARRYIVQLPSIHASTYSCARSIPTPHIQRNHGHEKGIMAIVKFWKTKRTEK